MNEDILKLLEEIKESINKLEKRIYILEITKNLDQNIQYPQFPTPNIPYNDYSTICAKCGMEWRGVMSYSCSRYDCPVQMKAT
jgi:hypothetical protein